MQHLSLSSPASPFSRPERRHRRGAALAWSLVFSAVLGGAVFASGPDRAAPVREVAGPPMVQKVVEQQLSALAAQDALQAFALADQDLRSQFGTAEAFLTAVREQYPMLLHPVSLLFLKPETDGRIALQKVRLSDQEGSAWTLTYLLHRQQDDQWRISGCVVTPEGRQIVT